MRIAIVYNRVSEKVINRFGSINRERYGKKSIERILAALKQGGHKVAAFEGDKDLIDNLEEFMPRVVKGERPGMVFNLAYGIQGQARYTHVPGILEMVGLPYVGSGPMAHSLALDKVVAKMLFVQNGLPTPEFAVLETPGFEIPDLPYPLIVKPRNEAVSFGIKIVNDDDELREAAGAIFERFEQPVLVERFIAGREINVGLLGNSPPDALPPAELTFGEGGPQIYTYEDKTRKSGRTVGITCPANLDDAARERVTDLAKRAFQVLGCVDCARVDLRLDDDGNFYILEINSLPSLGEHGSYVAAAQAAGLDFPALINRLVEVASARYFGTLAPIALEGTRSPSEELLEYVTSRRDRIERRIAQWTGLSSRTLDTVGVRTAFDQLDKTLREVGLQPSESDEPRDSARLWTTPAGFDGGTLLIGHVDVPLPQSASVPTFSRDPEWLYGEGIGSSRAPLVALEFALRALKRRRRLTRLPLGVLYYGDEGLDCERSSDAIRRAAARAKQVLVLRPGSTGDRFITQRRGVRHYALRLEGPARKPGQATKKPEVLRWAWRRLEQLCELSDRNERIAVSISDMKTTSYRNLLPHEVHAVVLVSYLDPAKADVIETEIRDMLKADRGGIRVHLDLTAERPPMRSRRTNAPLSKRIRAAAERWDIPYAEDSALLPSVAGLVPEETAVICGVGPAAVETFTAREAVERISVVQRTLLLAQLLFDESERA
ncbi:MAG: ATP-grasp domain-containing protein [Planctomycetes bacterium]|nr:ATP-grasp domain-containing protein [Planctomycetota bacterium]